MKNKISRFAMTILLPASLAFAACTEQTPETAPVKLEAPVVTVRSVTQTSVTFGWDAVEGASGYSCVAGSADAESTRETTFTMENLEAGTEYSIRVKAVSPDGRDYDSDWSLCSGTTSTLPAPTFHRAISSVRARPPVCSPTRSASGRKNRALSMRSQTRSRSR